MKNIILVSILLVAISYGCSNSNTSKNTISSNDTQVVVNAMPRQAVPDTSPLTGRWNLIPAMASDTAAGKLPFLSFDNGQVSGNTGCNNFRGGYKQAGANLSFNANMVTTRMACPGYDENAFRKSLLRTTGYDKKGDTLILKEDLTPLSYWLKGK